MNNDTFSSEIINSEDVFSDLEQQRQSGALTRAIREANAPQPVYGIDHERYGDEVSSSDLGEFSGDTKREAYQEARKYGWKFTNDGRCLCGWCVDQGRKLPEQSQD